MGFKEEIEKARKEKLGLDKVDTKKVFDSILSVYKPSKDILSSKVPQTLTTFLKNNSNIDRIILHLDNDEAGRLATKAIQNSLSVSYKIVDDPPKSGKDYNDYLCNYLKISRNNHYKSTR